MLLLVLVLTRSIGSAHAETCLSEAAGGGLNCNSNDITFDGIEITGGDADCDFPGDTVLFDGILYVTVGASTRYDVGFYVGLDALDSPDDDCVVAVAEPATLPNPQDGDICGDLTGVLVGVPVSGITAFCANEDLTYDVHVCSAWDKDADGADCTAPSLALPGNKSQCNCAMVDTFLPNPTCESNADCEYEINPCTDSICDFFHPEADAFGCLQADNTAPCSDSLFCTDPDICSRGSCIAGPARNCADDSACTEDSCSESTDACVFTPTPGACDDGLFCNGTDSCASGTCSEHAGDPCAGPDGDGNCVESCDETADTCLAPDPNGASCSDANACTEDDQCVGGLCAGAPLSCDDQNSCTTDLCDGTSPCTHEVLPDCTTTTIPPEIRCGDANGDGAVLASDAAKVLRHAVGAGTGTCDLQQCDADGSGTLTAGDALAVLRVAVGALTSIGQCPLPTH